MKFHLWSRKIHRILALITIGFGMIMTVTGLLLKFPIVDIDYNLIRAMHSNTSPLFAVSLLLMMATGMVMYLFPYLRK